MRLADLLRRYRAQLGAEYGPRLLPEQRRAADCIERCRTERCGQTLVYCPRCGLEHALNHSCNHRSCPTCQNHSATRWLGRQRAKLLPVRYYLLTFTVPAPLRPAIYRNQRLLYEALFSAATETIREVASNPRFLGAEPGMTTVLHTHSRSLGFHPHLHVIMPGGGIDRRTRTWKQGTRKYLFPSAVLKRLFRENFLALCRQAGISYPQQLHRIDWVVNIKAAGRGERALEYLSKYLYRGVIQERNILGDDNGRITFEYEDSRTGLRQTRALSAPSFLFRVLKHTLPKRFRRARDHGFLHGNCKRTLRLLQLIFRRPLATLVLKPPAIQCPHCKARFPLSLAFYERLPSSFLYPIRGSP